MMITIRSVTNGWVCTVSFEDCPSRIDTYVFNTMKGMCVWLADLYTPEEE